MQEISDEIIAQRVQRGDTEAFGALVQRYETKMLRYARRFLFGYDDAQDIVQEVFIRAYVNIQSFDTKRNFSSWLYRVAHNLFINTIKKKGREPLSFFDPDTFFPHPVAKERADSHLQEKELQLALENGLQTLSPKYREPLVLYYYEDMDYRTMSEVLQIPVATVGVRLNRGRLQLKKFFDTHQGKI